MLKKLLPIFQTMQIWLRELQLKQKILQESTCSFENTCLLRWILTNDALSWNFANRTFAYNETCQEQQLVNFINLFIRI
jgi:hypothetical protein